MTAPMTELGNRTKPCGERLLHGDATCATLQEPRLGAGTGDDSRFLVIVRKLSYAADPAN